MTSTAHPELEGLGTYEYGSHDDAAAPPVGQAPYQRQREAEYQHRGGHDPRQLAVGETEFFHQRPHERADGEPEPRRHQRHEKGDGQDGPMLHQFAVFVLAGHNPVRPWTVCHSLRCSSAAATRRLSSTARASLWANVIPRRRSHHVGGRTVVTYRRGDW